MKSCTYCHAVWPDPVLDIDHKPDCPFVTNLWPVQESDIAPHGFCCCGCGIEFVPGGDHYTTIPITGDDGHTDEATVEVVCLSCAVERLVGS